jgi:hypothetical protein
VIAERIVVRGATPEEAAAIVAAIGRFERDTAAAPVAAPAAGGRWLRAARLEDAGAGSDDLGPWGDSHPWGRGAR